MQILTAEPRQQALKLESERPQGAAVPIGTESWRYDNLARM